MELEKIDFSIINDSSVEADKLRAAMLQEAGVNQLLIKSSEGYESLKSAIENTMNENGIESIQSLEEAQNFVDLMKEQWEITDDSVMARTPLEEGDKENKFGEQSKETSRVVELKKVDDNKVEVNRIYSELASELGEEILETGFQDAQDILENGNRVEESIFKCIYEVNLGEEDIEIGKEEFSRVSTLEKEDFEQLSRENMSLERAENLLQKPEDYWNRHYKKTEDEGLSYSEVFQGNKIERKQYTEEQYKQMVENMKEINPEQTIEIKQGDNLSKLAREYNTTVEELVQANGIENPNLIYPENNLTIPKKQLSQEEIIQQALKELGVSEKLLDEPYTNGQITRMAQKSIGDANIQDIATEEGYKELLKQLNEDLVIDENYVAGKLEVADQTDKIVIISINEKGIVNEKYIWQEIYPNIQETNEENLTLEEIQKNKTVAFYESEWNGPANERLTSKCRKKYATIDKSEFEENGSLDTEFTVDQAIELANMPDEEFVYIDKENENGLPDILVNRMLGRDNNLEQSQETSIEQDKNENVEEIEEPLGENELAEQIEQKEPEEQIEQTEPEQQEEKEDKRGLLDQLLELYDIKDITQEGLQKAFNTIKETIKQVLQKLYEEREQEGNTKNDEQMEK